MDISIIYKIAAMGIIITVVCQILKKSDRDDIAMFVSIIGVILVLTVVVGMIGDLFTQIKDIFELSVIGDKLWKF
jgi:stage III sporulation protein AC